MKLPDEKVCQSIFMEVYGIYRSSRLPLPQPGDYVRIVNNQTGQESEALVISVNKEANTYDIRFLKSNISLISVETEDE